MEKDYPGIDAWRQSLDGVIQTEAHANRLQEFEDCIHALTGCWPEINRRCNNKPGTFYIYEETSQQLMGYVRRAYADRGLLWKHDHAPKHQDDRPYTSQGVAHGITVMLRFMYRGASQVGQQLPEASVDDLAQIMISRHSREALRQFAREARYTNQQLEHRFGLTHSMSAESKLGRLAMADGGLHAEHYQSHRSTVMQYLHEEGQPAEHIESDPSRYCHALQGGHWNRIYDDIVELCRQDQRLFAATLEMTTTDSKE